MNGLKNHAAIGNKTDECLSALIMSDSGQEHRILYNNPRSWEERRPIVPFVNIDDTNGSERLNIQSGAVTISTKSQLTFLHTKNSETLFLGTEEKFRKIGTKINPKKLEKCSVSLLQARLLSTPLSTWEGKKLNR